MSTESTIKMIQRLMLLQANVYAYGQEAGLLKYPDSIAEDMETAATLLDKAENCLARSVETLKDEVIDSSE